MKARPASRPSFNSKLKTAPQPLGNIVVRARNPGGSANLGIKPMQLGRAAQGRWQLPERSPHVFACAKAESPNPGESESSHRCHAGTEITNTFFPRTRNKGGWAELISEDQVVKSHIGSLRVGNLSLPANQRCRHQRRRHRPQHRGRLEIWWLNANQIRA